MKVFVPCDAAAIAVGADEVAAAVVREAAKAGVEINLVRNGSRGMFELEPLVEVETPAGRVGYARLAASDILRHGRTGATSITADTVFDMAGDRNGQGADRS